MVHPRLLARLALDQHQLQGRFGDREVGVARPALGRLGLDELALESDRSVHVAHVERELHPTHGSSSILMNVDVLTMPRTSTVVNIHGRLGCVPADAPTELPLIDVSAGAPCCTPIAGAPLDADQAADLAHVLKALADPARLRLLSVIQAADGGEACQCDLTDPVGLSQPTVSHHLKVLRDAGLVTATRRGTNIWYAAASDQVAALRAVLAPAQ
jgi:ArsR family transcriptional regulator